MSRHLAFATWLALLAGCAHPSLVLLADEDGGHGAVTIQKKGASGEATLVDQPDMRATLDGNRTKVRPLDSSGLKPAEAALLAGLPPQPRSFILYFNQGTVDLTPDSLPVLDELRAEIARRPGVDVQVTGHTDTVGSEADNDLLSLKRADEVLNLLASRGFDRSVMKAVGRGERELRQATADNVSNPINRRVEIIVR